MEYCIYGKYTVSEMLLVHEIWTTIHHHHFLLHFPNLEMLFFCCCEKLVSVSTGLICFINWWLVCTASITSVSVWLCKCCCLLVFALNSTSDLLWSLCSILHTHVWAGSRSFQHVVCFVDTWVFINFLYSIRNSWQPHTAVNCVSTNLQENVVGCLANGELVSVLTSALVLISCKVWSLLPL